MSEDKFDKFYFDIGAREFLDDEAALSRIDAGDETVRHVGTLLLDNEFSFQSNRGEQGAKEHWTRGELVQLGHWAIEAMQMVRPEETQLVSQLTRDHLERLRALDIGPSRYWFKRHFHTMWQYREALGIHAGHAVGKYKDWSSLDFIEYAKGLAGEPKRKLTEYDLNKTYEAGDGPGTRYIQEHFRGGLSALNEAIGFPDIKQWDKDDYIHWGAQVLEANDGQMGRDIINELSRGGHGPSERSIAIRFNGSLREFKRRAEEVLQMTQEDEAAWEQELSECFNELRGKDILPPELETADESERVLIAAKYKLARVCLPDGPEATYAHVAQVSSKAIISKIRQTHTANARLTPGYIEMLASTVGVFDIIWPMRGYMEYLKVPEEALAAARQRSADRWTTRKILGRVHRK